MQLLKEMINSYGEVCEGNVLKVGNFFNQQIDITLMSEMGKEFKKRFDNCGVTKVLTIEASGIAFACMTAQYFNVPMVFAKKSASLNSDDDAYTADITSFTRGRKYTITLPKAYLGSEDTVLIVDDFLATGSALFGLIDIVNASGAKIAGIGIGIEKAFQDGGKKVRAMGIRVEALAKIKSMTPGVGVEFCD